MVSPPYKGGYGANAIKGVASDGDGVIFESLGAFEGDPSSQAINDYLARRGASSWSSTPLMVPAALAPQSEKLLVFSPDLQSILFYTKPGPNIGSASYQGLEYEFLSHQTDTPDTPANWQLLGSSLKTLEPSPGLISYAGASSDFSSILFESKPMLQAAVASPETQLYQLATGDPGEAALRLVGLDNQTEEQLIDPACRTALGTRAGRRSSFGAIAAAGAEIFFTTNVKPGLSCEDPLNPEQLFVRLGGAKTLEISKPLLPPCTEVPCLPGAETRASAEFVGASEDGSKVFFTTAAPLVAQDTDSGADLYMASIACPGGASQCEPYAKQVSSLVQVSHDPGGAEAADVQGAVSMAPDASHVYFVARGMLTGVPSAGAQGYGAHGEAVSANAVAQPGADNLYLYEPAQQRTAFLVDLCSGPGRSGALSDQDCPLTLSEGVHGVNDTAMWLAATSEAQTAGDGAFLAFTSYGRLVASDADSAKDVYRYDAQSGLLQRVSIGEAGADENGNNGRYDATISTVANAPAISEDGTRVIFTTAEPLSEKASNGLANLYVWHEQAGGEGSVSLVSSGTAAEPIERAAIAAQGNDIFFVTSQGLVEQDVDGADDVYDARVGGGFPAPAEPPQSCSSDGCQGPLSTPAPLLVPITAIQQAPGNLAAPSKRPLKKHAAKAKPRRKKQKRKARKSARAAAHAKAAAGSPRAGASLHTKGTR
jgi:hypothetical protein